MSTLSTLALPETEGLVTLVGRVTTLDVVLADSHVTELVPALSPVTPAATYLPASADDTTSVRPVAPLMAEHVVGMVRVAAGTFLVHLYH